MIEHAVRHFLAVNGSPSGSADGSATVYRAYSNIGTLLYVGITGPGLERMHRHAKQSGWWRDAVRVELTHYPTREAALEAEHEAIWHELPCCNVVKRQVAPACEHPDGYPFPAPQPEAIAYQERRNAPDAPYYLDEVLANAGVDVAALPDPEHRRSER